MEGIMRKNVLPALIITILLAACGGGGGGGDSDTQISTETFQAATVFSNQINNGYVQNFSITGSQVVNGRTYKVTGSGTLVVSPAVGAVFENQAALMNVVSVDASVTVNGVTLPVTSMAHSYSTSNYAPLGETNGEYCVVQGIATIPTAVQVGDTAQVGTMVCYADINKATTLGTVRLSYIVEADTTSTAVLNLISKEYDNSNTLLLTDEARWRLDTLGNVTWVSETVKGVVPPTMEPFTYVFQ
jgi:hypothetical protein